MEFWEVVKALTENKEQEFKAQDGFIAYVGEGGLLELSRGNAMGIGVNENVRIVKSINSSPDKWELIREEVDFMTAVNSGKNIKPCTEAAKVCNFHNWNYWGLTLEIINGKWVVE